LIAKKVKIDSKKISSSIIDSKNHFSIQKSHNLQAAQESGKIIEVPCGILCSNFLKREIIFFTTKMLQFPGL
jgi:hypothetical protein